MFSQACVILFRGGGWSAFGEGGGVCLWREFCLWREGSAFERRGSAFGGREVCLWGEGEGSVFGGKGVCLWREGSAFERRGFAFRGGSAFERGGGVCLWRGSLPLEGDLPLKGGGGFYMEGADLPPPPTGGRYDSYWNAFLFGRRKGV